MAQLVPLQFITSILVTQLTVAQMTITSPALACPSDQFECLDKSKCIHWTWICDGVNVGSCDDNSQNFPSQCDNCSAHHLFQCKIDGVHVCVNVNRKCDGNWDCDDGFDESTSLCSPPCSEDMFACEDGSRCIPKSQLCNGYASCEDLSNTVPSRCDGCSADHLFRCQVSGVDVCLDSRHKCDGIVHCDGNADELASQCENCVAEHLSRCQSNSVYICLNVEAKCDGVRHCTDDADELVSECPNCVDNPAMFTCTLRGHKVCLSKDEYQCNGITDSCDDLSDELASVCNNCNQPNLSMCRDGSRCVQTSDLCDGDLHCADGSDESDTWSKCNYCKEKNSVPCPGFPGNCAKLCDGSPTCPDAWDELLYTCKSKVSEENGLSSISTAISELGNVPASEAQTAICSKEAGLHQCNDNSRCLQRNQLCNNMKDCVDGSDESAEACKDKCQSYRSDGVNLLSCDKGSCIRLHLACSAQTQPLCKDGKDMAYDLCKGKCYTLFPGTEDPYRWPCKNGKKCILQTSRCDGYPDCDDATDLSYASDEQNCPLVTRVGLPQTLLLCLAIVTLSWILFFIFISWSGSVEQYQRKEDNILAPSSSDPTSSSPPSGHALPSFLLHPALSDMDSKHWSWREVGEQLRLEVVFFNRDPQVLFGFLYRIEAQDAHPDNVHKAFKGFTKYLVLKGYDAITVAQHIRQTIGHHKLAHMALQGPPNFIDRKVFEIGKWVKGLENRGGIFFCLVSSLRAIQTSMSPFFLNLDYVKDVVLFLILRETMERLEGNCKHISDLGIDCLAASGTEQDLLLALLVTVCTSLILTSINSFFLRKRFFKTNHWISLVLGFVSPLLHAVYHIRLSQMRRELNKLKTKISQKELRKQTEEIETLSNSVQQTKEIEVGLEAVMQILLLLGLACFYPYVFKAPSGQTYSYFFGVALLVLKGNIVLFFASLFFSFLGPCFFYVSRTNALRHGSLNMSRKLVLMARNVLFLLVRVLAITSAIFIPVIKEWDMLVGNHGLDASSLLTDSDFFLEFQKYFSNGLDALTADIRKNAQFFLLFLFIHFMLVASHAIFCSAKFGKSKMRERALHLISSFWLPLPFLTIRGVDRGEEKAELWFLIVLHSLENFLIVSISRIVYLQESYPLEIVIFDCVLFLLNLLGVALSIFYVYTVELYAGLPQEHPTLPSYGPEVSLQMH